MRRDREGPLAGRRIVITRARQQAGALRKQLERLGAEVLELPTIAICRPRSWGPLDRALSQLESYDWIIFTSANGVRSFFERLNAKRESAEALAPAKLCAIGPATAEALRERRLRVHRMPEEYRAEGVVAALKKENLKGRRVLIPRARVARDLVPVELRKRGARVDVVEAYRTLLPPGSRARARKFFARRKPDLITFTSSSTARNFSRLFPARKLRRALEGVAVASIGPITTATARALGLRVEVEAEPYTIPGLVRAIVAHFGLRERRPKG